MFFISFQQQELLNNLQKVQTALHPKLDLRPSIFSKHVDNFIEISGEEPVTYLGDRPERRFLGPLDPSIDMSQRTGMLITT